MHAYNELVTSNLDAYYSAHTPQPPAVVVLAFEAGSIIAAVVFVAVCIFGQFI